MQTMVSVQRSRSPRPALAASPPRLDARGLALALVLAACSPTGAGGATDGAIASATCDDVTPLAQLADLATTGTAGCRTWLDIVRGRVARNSAGSAIVWSRRTTEGYGVLLATVHTLGLGALGPIGSNIAEQFKPPGSVGAISLSLPGDDGSLPLTTVSPMYTMYNPDIPAAQYDGTFASLRPRNDFHIALVDHQRAPARDDIVPAVNPREPGLVSLYDPQALSLSDPLGAAPAAGTLVMLVGYPQDTANYPEGAVAVARTLGDEDAAAAIAWLAASGDSEGAIAYDPEAEYVVEGVAVNGMSGGGAFDASGALVGMMVRASDPGRAHQYVRVVRLSYAVGRAHDAWAGLPASSRTAIVPFVDPRIAP
ncbi:hypothetical protein BH11MYX1_BH11MYX1_43290 [soil metagenome]